MGPQAPGEAEKTTQRSGLCMWVTGPGVETLDSRTEPGARLTVQGLAPGRIQRLRTDRSADGGTGLGEEKGQMAP